MIWITNSISQKIIPLPFKTLRYFDLYIPTVWWQWACFNVKILTGSYVVIRSVERHSEERITMSKPLMIQKVSPVDRASQPLEEIPMRNAIEQLVGGRIESCSDFAKSVVGQRLIHPNDDLTAAERFRHLVRSKGLVHPFVGAVHQAYADHRPLVLSPDMFWLLICQGVAQHVNVHADGLRSKFVQHARKQLFSIRT